MNMNAVSKALHVLGPTIANELLNMEAEVSEKIHGENFRVGVDTRGSFVGQRNGTFYNVEDHPNWNKLNKEARDGILSIPPPESMNENFTAYGELCGNGMQSGFTYPWDGLKVVFFDLQVDGDYLPPRETKSWFENKGLEYVPLYHESMTVKEAVSLDVNNMKSLLTGEDHIEGVVIKVHDVKRLNDLWKLHGRFIIKHKADTFSEMSKKKDRSPKVVYDSPFVDFVTPARIEHAIQAIEERTPGTIKGEMADMRFIIHEVVDDIEREENGGEPLPNDDKKSVTRAVPKMYQSMLSEQITKQLGL